MDIYQVSKVASFKMGFVVLALDNRVPIIPVAIVPGLEKELIKIPGALVKPFVKHTRGQARACSSSRTVTLTAG